MSSERDLLILLCDFISKKQMIVGDEASIRNMVAVYEHPPFTLAYPVALRMTMADTYKLNDLLKQAYEILSRTELVTQ